MKQILVFLLLGSLLVSLAACAQGGPGTSSTQKPSIPDNLDLSGKYQLDKERNEAIIHDGGTVTAATEGNARVFYQIFVGSFSDSNGDGIGDLRGIINRFDYLNDGQDNSGLSLGIEGIWLTPIFQSPSYHKYDVADYYKIDPQFGTEADLQELIDLCHSRNVKLIIDLPINHTSKNHVWFTNFAAAHKNQDTESEYYDYYCHSTKSEGNRVFNTIPGASDKYECNFSTDMPELDFDNEVVRQEVVNIAKYYLEMGIDGFRFDAAKYIYLGDDVKSTAFWDWYMAQLRSIKPDMYSVAEVWSGDAATYPYFSSNNCFNFTMAQGTGNIAQAARNGDVNAFTRYVESYLSKIHQRNPDAMIVPFIANHDTDRAAGFLTVASGQAKVAASLNLLMPGSPFIYYGEEIGLKGSRGSSNTDANRRLAMLWGDNDTVKDPIGANYRGEQTNGTVADQLPNGDSLYNHYKKLIQIRKANPEIACGTYKALQLEGTKLGGFVSTYEGKSVAVLHNSTTEELRLDLSTLPELAAMKLTAFAGVGSARIEGTTLILDAQTSVVLR